MNILPDIKLWRDRLIAQVPDLRRVDLVASAAAAEEATLTTPHAFVMQVANDPRTAPGFGNAAVHQNMTLTVGVVLAVSNLRDARGGEAAADIDLLRDQVIDCLHGWTPPDVATAVRWARGALLPFRDSTVWYSDRFVTSFFVRKDFES